MKKILLGIVLATGCLMASDGAAIYKNVLRATE